jgi:flagellar biosynthesis regulator FlaF
MYKNKTTDQVRDRRRVGSECLDGVAALLMAMQRHWDEPNREARLALTLAANRKVWCDIQDALADGSLSLPLEAQQNLLILSVYANDKLDDCAAEPSANTRGSLIALTRNLAGSLREWRVAA